MGFTCYIGIGLCSKYFLLILGTCIFRFLKESLFNFFQINPSSQSGMFAFMPVLSGHFIISSIYTYISYIIFSLLLNLISEKKSKTESEYKRKETLEKLTSLLPKGVMQNKTANKITFSKILKTMGACSVIIIQQDFSKIIYLFEFSSFNIWTFYVVFILFFMKKYYVIQLYKHQKYSMIFVIVICSILLITATFLPYDSKGDYNAYQKVNNITGSYYAFIPILIIFISLTCMTSFFITYSKALMEIEMFPPYILILITGITGLLLNLFVLIFTSSFKCTMENFIKNICIVFNSEGNSYYDNLLIYFSNLKSRYDNDDTRKDFFLEIFLVYPLYLIFSFLEFVCQIFSIYYLNPNYILIKDPIYFGTLRLVFLFYNINDLSPYMYLSQFFLLELAEIFGLLGYLVYLEILELKFCGLDSNLKRRILYRTDNEKTLSLQELNILTDDPERVRSDSITSNDSFIN